MNNKKVAIIIIAVFAVILISIVIISLLFVNANRTDQDNNSTDLNNNTSIDEASSDKNDNIMISDQDEANNSQEETRAADQALQEARTSDPIYKHIGEEGYRTESYTIYTSADGNNNLVLTILINSSEPTTAQGRATVKQYENDALQQIRSWGFDPNNYTILVKYRY